MTKIDRLAVAVEQIANCRTEDHALMTRLGKKIDDLIDCLKADGGDGETSEAAEDPHAWVGVVREAYKTMGEHNLTLVDLVAGHLGITEEEANAKLMTRIPSSRRRNSRASSTIVAYRYLRRAVSHFYENLGKAAVKGFISSVNDSTGMARQVLVTGSRTRTVLTLTREAAIHLLTGDRYISEGFGKKALLAGASNMFAALGAGHLVEKSSPDSADKTIVCILAQMALGSTKVREHLKLRAYGGLAAQATAAGVNKGHRQPWIRELTTLDRVYWRLPETCNGLRFTDAASPLRATANRPPTLASGAVAAGAGGAVADGGDDEDDVEDGYSAEAVGDGLLEQLD
ncbi:hypothetical protein I4F81_006309 [Pyropia yezoensis]|uniref:Uncharacterized protein n=1 Tax=Pyropia yezoensis TaxID=2788 RepID=A0ACC3C0V0_PYRYE|nr:hypothetical protein I4F81_006309 [Neopyropia yezoensis]